MEIDPPQTRRRPIDKTSGAERGVDAGEGSDVGARVGVEDDEVSIKTRWRRDRSDRLARKRAAGAVVRDWSMAAASSPVLASNWYSSAVS